MQLELASKKARVARGELRQQQACAFDEGSLVVLLSALGPPRLWGYALDAAEAGLRDGLARPHDGRMTARMQQGLEGAQRSLRDRIEALIERQLPDVGLLAVARDEGRLHVVCVGPLRAYLRRGAQTQRLTPRDDRAEGLLKATPTWCTEQVSAGLLAVGGTLSAFSEHTLAALGTMLVDNPAAQPADVVSLLNGPAAQSGVGVASFAFRT